MHVSTRRISVSLIILLNGNTITHAEPPTRQAFQNDAITIDARGHRSAKVMPEARERYPSPPFYAKAPITAPKVGSPAFDASYTTLYMIEGKDGLMECSAPTLDAMACRASTYGSVKRLRYWIVLQNSQWIICHVAKPSNPKVHDGVVCSNDFPKPPARPTGSVVPEVMITMGTGIYPE